MDIQQIDQFNREWIDEFILRQWFSMQMVVHGESIDLGTAAGYYAVEGDEIIGLITYRITDNEMEILSLDSLRENKGIGTELLNKAIFKAVETGCSKITLITTNDNLLALRFYQKRGFDMCRLYYNAIEQSRKIKPEIPLFGENGIRIKHEIQFEMIL